MTPKKDTRVIHVITGYKDSIAKYKTLGKVRKIDWDKPLSSQVFKVNKNDTIIGFSLGAVLACLIAKKYGCRAILCSMTDIQSYKRSIWISEMDKSLNKEDALNYVEDIMSLNLKPNKDSSIILAGELEKKGVWKGDLLVPETGHVMNKAYINAIMKILS